MTDCPSTQELDALANDQLVGTAAEHVNVHVENCLSCQEQLDQICESPAVGRILKKGAAVQMATNRWSAKRVERLVARLKVESFHEAFCETDDPDSCSQPTFPLISGFKINSILGRGGMGVVYHARQLDLQRDVALKVMDQVDHRPVNQGWHPSLKQDDNWQKRFAREARLTAKLDHPSIVPVYQIGNDDAGRCFYTMRLIDGKTLDTVFRLARTSSDGWNRTRVVSVMSRVCQTVAYAHQHGVIHRDLKPSNIMVGKLGEIYVLDWGLGRDDSDTQLLFVSTDDMLLSNMEAPEARDPIDEVETIHDSVLQEDIDGSLMTVNGSIMGTPSFMSPEQAKGAIHEIGPPSDIYSLGAILYTWLVGHPPYQTSDRTRSSTELVRAVQEDNLSPILEKSPDAEPELAAICEKAMARQPADRYTSAEDFADDLQAYLENRVVGVYHGGAFAGARLWVRRNPAVAAVSSLAIFLALTGLLVAVFLQTGANRDLLDANQKINLAFERESQARSSADQAQSRAEAAAASESKAKRDAYRLLAQSYLNFAENEADGMNFGQASLWYSQAAQQATDEAEQSQLNWLRSRLFRQAAFAPVAAWYDRQDYAKRGWLDWPMTSQLQWDPNGRYLYTRSTKHGITLLELHPHELVKIDIGNYLTADFDPSGIHIALVDASGNIDIVRLSDQQRIARLPPASSKSRPPLPLIQYSSDGNGLLVHNAIGQLQIADVERKQWRPKIYPVASDVNDIAFNHKATALAAKSPKQFRQFAVDAETPTSSERIQKPARQIDLKSDGAQQQEFEANIGKHSESFRFQEHLHLPPRYYSDGLPTTIDKLLNRLRFGDHGEVSIQGAQLSPDRSRIAIAHGNGVIRIWRINSVESVRRHYFRPSVRAVWSHDSQRYAVIGDVQVADKPAAPEQVLSKTKVYDAQTGEPLGPTIDAGGAILGGCFSHDDQHLVLACSVKNRCKATLFLPNGEAGNLQVWDWRTGQQIGEPIAVPSEPLVIALHPTKNEVGIGCAAGEVLKLDLATRAQKILYDDDSQCAPYRHEPCDWGGAGIAFHDSGDWLMRYGFNGTGLIFDYANQKTKFVNQEKGWCSTLLITNQRAIFLNRRHSAQVHELDSDRWLRQLGNTGQVGRLDQSGRYLISCGVVPKSTFIHDLERGELACQPLAVGGRDSAFVPGTSLAITTTLDRQLAKVIVWSRLDGRLVYPVFELSEETWVSHIAVSPNGHDAAISTNKGLYMIDLSAAHDRDPRQGLSPHDAHLLSEITAGGVIRDGRLVRERGESWVKKWDDFHDRHPKFLLANPTSEQSF